MQALSTGYSSTPEYILVLLDCCILHTAYNASMYMNILEYARMEETYVILVGSLRPMTSSRARKCSRREALMTDATRDVYAHIHIWMSGAYHTYSTHDHVLYPV